MAFATNETAVVNLTGGTDALLLVCGTYASSAGGTGGVIIPGYTNTNGVLTAISPTPASIGGRFIKAFWFVPTTNDATAPGAAKSYDSATYDREIITQVTTADSTGLYFMLCQNAGA